MKRSPNINNNMLTPEQIKSIRAEAGAPETPQTDVSSVSLVDRLGIKSPQNKIRDMFTSASNPQATEAMGGTSNTNAIVQSVKHPLTFAGGVATSQGATLPLTALDTLAPHIVKALPEDFSLAGVSKQQMLDNLGKGQSLNDQFKHIEGADVNPVADTSGKVAGTIASLTPLALENVPKIATAIGEKTQPIIQAGKDILENRAQGEIDTFAKELVSPKATEAVKETALKQGRVVEPGILKSGKILPSKRDTQVAEAVKPFISPKNTPVQNLNSISDGVQEINNGVKQYVQENKVPFNTNQLKTQLNKGKDELNLIFASDSNAKKTYDAVVSEFVKHVENKDTAGLFEARQEFDKIPAIKKLLDSQGLGENTKKEVVLTVRDMANKYVANLLPEGNTYRNSLLQESKMIEAIGNLAEKNTGLIGNNKLELLTKKYPILKWVAGGLVGAGGVGVGGALIGSTD